jgi:hypothetical protein
VRRQLKEDIVNSEERGRKMGKILAKAWEDDVFKQRLLKDPKAVLNEEGLETHPTLEIRAVENTEKVFHLVIPPKPDAAELSDDQLQSIAGGALPGIRLTAWPAHPTCDAGPSCLPRAQQLR